MGGKKLLLQLVWLIIWFTIAMPISLLCGLFYAFLNLFSACCPIRDCIDCLHKGVNFSGKASQGVTDGSNIC